MDGSYSSLELGLLIQGDFLLSLIETSKVTLGYPHQANQLLHIGVEKPHMSHHENLENANLTVQTYQKMEYSSKKLGLKFTEVPLAMDLDT